MNDMSPTIEPKSDQLNADDLIPGPRTITITRVLIKPGEQPVSVFFNGDHGKPWKPSKSMCRVMVYAWGPDASKYIGKSLTLFRDPHVKWGGMEVGGIRISHMSDIGGKITLSLTETRGKFKPYLVEPMKAAAAAPPAVREPRSAVKATKGSREPDFRVGDEVVAAGPEPIADNLNDWAHLLELDIDTAVSLEEFGPLINSSLRSTNGQLLKVIQPEEYKRLHAKGLSKVAELKEKSARSVS